MKDPGNISKKLVTLLLIFTWLCIILSLLLFIGSHMQNARLEESLSLAEQTLKSAYEEMNDYRQVKNREEKLEQKSLDYLEWQFVLKEQVSDARGRLSTQINKIRGVKKDKALVNLLYYTLGLSDTLATDFNAAVQSFEEAVKFDPKDAESYYNLGLLSSVSRQNRHKAVMYYKKYLELAPEGPKSREVKERIGILKKS